MRELILESAGVVTWRHVRPPCLESSLGAIVRPVAVAVCDFDRSLVQGYRDVPGPVSLGHEMVAEVVEVGTEVRDIAVGMRVIVPLHVNCGTCPQCTARRTNCCAARPVLANYGVGPLGGSWGGAMSDRVQVPYADAMLMPVPAGGSAIDYVAVSCNLVDVYRTIAPYLPSLSRPSFLILGGRSFSIALYAVVIARALGIEDVTLASDDAEQRTEAVLRGANVVGWDDAAGKMYDLIADCSGDPNRLRFGLARIARGGVCTTVTPYDGAAELPMREMFLRNATLVTGQPHARADMESVLDLVARNRFSTTSIPSEVLPWESAVDFYGRGKIKRVFVRN